MQVLLCIQLPKYLEIVKKKGSSSLFSAQGGRGKEKNCKPAENNAVGSEGAAEGGCGGNSAAPGPRRSPAALPEALRAESSKNIFFSLIEKNFRGRAKSKIVKKMFLLGTRALRAAAGRSVSFVQNRFGFGQINAPVSNFQIFDRPIRRRVAPPHTAKWGFRALRARPSGGSKSLAILSICFAQLKINKTNL